MASTTPQAHTKASPHTSSEAHPATPPTDKQQKKRKQKGRKNPKHSLQNEKFNLNNIPLELKIFFKKQLKLQYFKNEIIQEECLRLIGNSLAQSTWKRYASSFKIWKKFCNENNKKETHLSESTKIMFICWCSKNTNLKSSTISIYLSAINHCLTLLAVDKGGGGILRAAVVRGLKNSQSKLTGKRKKICKPVTVPMLKTFRHTLMQGGGHKDVTRKSVWAVAIVAFWGCFRLGELLCEKRWSFDKYSNLLWGDIQLGPDSVQIGVKSGKTSGDKPIWIRLGALPEKDLCPWKALKNLKTQQEKIGIFDKNLPVFRKKGGQNLRPRDLIRALRQTVGPLSCLTGKSFRSGIPSILADKQGEFGPTELKNFGRWKSAAFQKYIRGGNENLDLYRKITNYVLTNDMCRSTRQEEKDPVPRLGQQQRI